MRPPDGFSSALLLWQIPRAPLYGVEALLQPGEHGLRREHAHPGSGELDGQGEPVESPANLRDCGAFSLSTAKSGVTACARSMKSRTASYWVESCSRGGGGCRFGRSQ